jgi:putative beta-lysine N-acetyltransferase
MAHVYRVVFASYPFPIHDPEYLKQTMATTVRYFCAEEQGKIVALSSAEFDFKGQNVEMTDFATLPDTRGRGIALSLLALMEQDPKVRTMRTAYTIARSLSPGMNITFAKAGYAYGGTLTNNTDISGSIESMNIWYKTLIRNT